MGEHSIGLRRAWRSVDGRRVDLPSPPEAGPLPPRLTRRFQAPNIDPRCERLWLVLEDVPGLERLSLDGLALTPSPGADGRWEFALDGLSTGGKVLILDLDPSLAAASAKGWGHVSLVIRG